MLHHCCVGNGIWKERRKNSAEGEHAWLRGGRDVGLTHANARPQVFGVLVDLTGGTACANGDTGCRMVEVTSGAFAQAMHEAAAMECCGRPTREAIRSSLHEHEWLAVVA